MSAYLVSDNHINFIINYAHRARMEKIYVKRNKEEIEFLTKDMDEKEIFNPNTYYKYHYRVFDTSDIKDLQKMAQILVDENYRSINARYRNEYGQPHEIKFELSMKNDLCKGATLNHVKVYNAIRCLDYQSCETDDWEESTAFKILKQIQNHAVSKVMKIYDRDEAGSWGIE